MATCRNSELDAELARIAAERDALEARVAALEPSPGAEVPEAALDLLDQVRARLDAGLSDEKRGEIVRLLVKIVVHTELPVEGGKKAARAALNS